MKKILFTMSIFIFLGSNLYGEQYNAILDGGKWKQFNRYLEAKRMKIACIQGIYEGAWAMDGDKAKELYYFTTDYENIVSRLDEFYSDEDNLEIPLSHALYIIAMKLKGVQKDSIEGVLNKFRKGQRMQFLK